MDSADAAPPFPDDVPTAPLLRLSLAKLRAREPDEVRRFTAACEALGFFYLDLGGDAVLQQADALFDAGRALFDLPLAEKARYDFSRLGTYMGYKAVGASVADAAGNLDRNEFYNIGKDDVFELGRRWPAPEVLESRRALLRSFMQSAHGIVTLVLALLDTHLGLAPGTLGAMHRLLEGRGGDQVRFIRAPARGGRRRARRGSRRAHRLWQRHGAVQPPRRAAGADAAGRRGRGRGRGRDRAGVALRAPAAGPRRRQPRRRPGQVLQRPAALQHPPRRRAPPAPRPPAPATRSSTSAGPRTTSSCAASRAAACPRCPRASSRRPSRARPGCSAARWARGPPCSPRASLTTA
ncbi:hypothetical protein MAA_09733 [Metarhizium robertsii ARSEF 23]|uniref:Non-haem dioxygenase N-terminal domain-containing protein n=1 Tax=Metarhizium robertsii (strain ARSEF 23 / ATCC MYA-3075) TaxID=655844 RepID=E9FBT4_METRA|nr:uncharacterized protein MAA_09733 [Metarhizium robertsii ARSEF 23]EFY94800.2 hypothetical protein MAA_09733 [Metarhizium robertsii ARSEF 23]